MIKNAFTPCAVDGYTPIASGFVQPMHVRVWLAGDGIFLVDLDVFLKCGDNLTQVGRCAKQNYSYDYQPPASNHWERALDCRRLSPGMGLSFYVQSGGVNNGNAIIMAEAVYCEM